MKSYFAYIRVSTAKQGEQGSSLHEQRDAITAFAARQGFAISAWFEERETAAKTGRGEFSRMLAALKKGKASGVIFHKIDRSARNLKDWSTIQDLAEQGIDVRFTQESINLGSNEGKLTGDFLAVISSHYIRNLREEVKKGIRGRLKQGLYPLRAPLGYLDQGSAKPKTPDPARAPLVRDAFELYASGRFALRGLTDELHRRGLRNRSGKAVTVNGLSVMLRNPFYMGIIRMKGSGEVFSGVHQPLVRPKLFSRVQAILDGKLNAKLITHEFLFRRMIRCAHCRYHLIAERQKGHVYYRCHTQKCPTCTVREESVESAIRASLAPLSFLDDEMDEMRDMAAALQTDWGTRREDLGRAIKLKIDNVTGRLSRLMDAYVDGAVVMHGFTPDQLPVISALAKGFGVSDRWHASAPNQTWPNRFFVHTGTAAGYVNNSPSHPPYLMPTIFNRLTRKQRSWRIYHHDLPQTATLAMIWSELPDHLYSFEGDFMADAMNGRLPNYSFIEPRYFSDPILRRMPNDQHPPHNVLFGERLIARVYDALRNGPAWEQTLFIITYDEHGGIYDHVPPPAAVPPDALQHDGFTFNRYGVRVPAVIVSPWVPAGSIIRPPDGSAHPFDHTSILATLRKLFDLGDPLTRRDAAAPDLLHALSLDTPSNSGPANLQVPAPDVSNEAVMAAHEEPPNHLQQALAEMASHLPAGAANVPAHAAALDSGAVPPVPRFNTVKEALDHARTGLTRFLNAPGPA